MSEITLEQVAMMVECPECGACEIGSEDVSACWTHDGFENVPTHPSRLDAAREQLALRVWRNDWRNAAARARAREGR